MLVLSRKADQKIMIGDDIEVTVVRIEGNRVRLGINAPREMRILRGELSDVESAGTVAQYELSEREFAFAHQNATDRIATKQTTTSRESKSPNAESQLFAGTVSADGSKVQLTSQRNCGQESKGARRAPLSNFVSAS